MCTVKLSIEQVILWPRDPSLPSRVIDFAASGGAENGVIHVIRGTNETGKSALVGIIDYCLGAASPQIPRDPIFETVLAYGLVLRGPRAYTLVARGAPPRRGTSDEYYFGQEAEPFEVPSSAPTPNASAREYAAAVDALVGLDVFEEVADEDGPGRGASPLLHDLTPFLLAPSEYLTRPTGLFHTREVSLERVKRMIPITLKAATAEYVKLKERWQKARRELRKVEERVRIHGNALAGVERAVHREYASAVHFGLIKGDVSEADYEGQLPALIELHSRLSGAVGGGNSADTWRALLARLQALKTRERSLSRRRSALRTELAQIREVMDAAAGIAQGIELTSDRTQAFHWFAAHADEAAPCPLCGTDSDVAHRELQRIVRALWSLRDEQKEVADVSDDFEGRAADIEASLREIEESSRQAGDERIALMEVVGDDAASGEPVTLSEVSRVIGALEPIAASSEQLAQLTRDRAAAEAKKSEFASLDERLGSFQFEDLYEDLEKQLVENIQCYAELMELGNAESPVSLPLRTLQLGIRIDGARGSARRKLEQLGSGKNWMGYKLSAHLALHELFHLFEGGPVPSFFVVDQLSQVDSSGAPDGVHKSLTRRAFEAMVQTAVACKMQIIVLEGMAEDETFLSFLTPKEVRIVEEWPDGSGRGLIPKEWITQLAPASE